MRTLARVQRGLETLYRIDTGVVVDDFMIDEASRDALVRSRRPREQLLAIEDRGEMALALYIDPAAIAKLDAGTHDFGELLLAIEGVSHFIYAIVCARADRTLTQLELELQAEVDKYVTCLLTGDPGHGRSRELRGRLYGDCAYEPDLDGDERDRYRAANDNAHRYAAWLESEFVAPRRIPEMLGELRRFYRHGLAAKLSTIARAA
jgi:hypothetical protein